MTSYDLMSSDYNVVDGETQLFLFGRGLDQARRAIRVRGFKPRFYVPDEAGTFRSIYGTPLTRIFTNKPGEVKQERTNYEQTFAAKVPYWLVYLVEKGVTCSFQVTESGIEPIADLKVKPRVGYFDFEMISPPEIFPRPKKPIYPIVNIGYMDSYDQTKHLLFLRNPDIPAIDGVEYFNTERELYNRFVELTKDYDPDSLSGWFSNSYDLHYLIRRASMLGVDLDGLSPVPAGELPTVSLKRIKKEGMPERWEPIILGRECCDLLEFYRVLTKPEGMKLSWDLKYIVQEECGYSYEDLGDRIDVFWKTDHRPLREYGLAELEALRLIDEKRNLISEFDHRRRIVGTRLQGSHIALRCIDPWLQRVARSQQQYLPTLELSVKQRYKGALVADVERGFHYNVGVFDIRGLYPSIIVSRNLSLETKYMDGSRVRFKLEPEGILARAVRILIEERNRLRAALKNLSPESSDYKMVWTRQEAFKYLVNAFYGAMKHYDYDIARTITETGRSILTQLSEQSRTRKYPPLYWDTDGLHIRLQTSNWQEGLDLEGQLNDDLTRISQTTEFKTPLELRFEKFYSTIFYKESKCYAGWMTMRDKKTVDAIDIVGLAAKKSNNAIVTQRTNVEFWQRLLKEGPVAGIAVLRSAWTKFSSYPLQEIAIPLGLTRVLDLDSYKKTTPWIRGVENAQRIMKLRFREDKKPMLVCVHGGSIRELCINDDTEKVPFPIDWRAQKEKALKNRFEEIVTLLGHNWGEIETGMTQARLI